MIFTVKVVNPIPQKSQELCTIAASYIVVFHTKRPDKIIKSSNNIGAKKVSPDTVVNPDLAKKSDPVTYTDLVQPPELRYEIYE